MFIKVKSPMTNTQLPIKRYRREKAILISLRKGPHFLPLRCYVKSEETRQCFPGYSKPPQSHIWQEWGKTLLETQIQQRILPSQNIKPNQIQLLFIIHIGLSSICLTLWKMKRMEPTVSNSPFIFLLITVSYKLKKQQRSIHSSLSLLACGHKTNGDCQGYICLFCPTWSISRGLSLKRRLRRTYASPYYQDTTSASGHWL